MAKNKDDAGKTEDVQYITPTRMRSERGWTDSLIDMLLGGCDKEVPNPHYKSAYPMRLYELPRVIDAEDHQAFKDAQVKLAKRRSAAQKGVETKTRNITQWAMNVEIQYRFPNAVEKARRNGYESWRDHKESRSWRYDDWYDYEPIMPFENQPKENIDRWAVNWLRHERSDYDDTLLDMYGKTGKDIAYVVIRNRILDKIAEKFPELATEALSQKL